MRKKLNITPEFVKSVSYTDFVGLLNQWNVLPGSFVTLSKWIQFSGLNKKSHILEAACTTGFTSRELARMTDCSGIGFDISKASVEMANYNKKIYAPKIKINYLCQNGYKFESKGKFSHIIFGAALRFFSDPERMLKKSLTLLEDEGKILSTEFYTIKPIPKILIKRAQKVFNITPTEVPYKEVMKIYKGLEIIYEDRNILIRETPEELAHYCTSTIDRACKILKINNKSIYKAMYDRLYQIKEMSNLLRPYQNYNVLVSRYRKSVYPNRYVELF